MKIEIFGKEREITLKDCLIVIGEILLVYGFIELQVYFDDEANAEGMAKMQAAIPAVVSMDGTESLPEKIKMVSRTRGFYYGRCHINEKASEKDIVKHYKSEFQKHGWKYIGRFYSETLSPDPILKGWCHYCFEKEGPYWMSFSLGEKKSDINPITKRDPEFDSTSLIFYIDLKKDYDDRKYCQIEDEEP